MHQNSTKHTKTSVYGLMGWIGCVRCEKFRRDFVARTFELVRTVLHQFCKETKRSQMVRNATKHEFSVQWGRSGAFIAKNFDATSWHKLLHYFGPFCTEFRKVTKQSKMHLNGMKCNKT